MFFSQISKIISNIGIVVQCKKKHVTVCPEFSDTGLCPRGKRCPLRHVTKKRQLVDVSTPAKTEQDAVGYACISLSCAVFIIFLNLVCKDMPE